MYKSRFVPFVAFTATVLNIAPVHGEPSKPELVQLLETVDEHQKSAGDFRSDTYVEQKKNGKLSAVYEAQVFRRSADARFMILFTAPKDSQGQGYLRIDTNLWFYDPAVGKWERRTERERIGDTNSKRIDFDESRLADEYEPASVGEEKLGANDVTVLSLTAKRGHEPTVPVLKIWVDKETKNVLKRQEFATSGRLLRTCYYPRWQKVHSNEKGADVWFPAESRLYDEVEKDSSTLLLIKGVDVKPLAANIFTKAWLESKSR